MQTWWTAISCWYGNNSTRFHLSEKPTSNNNQTSIFKKQASSANKIFCPQQDITLLKGNPKSDPKTGFQNMFKCQNKKSEQTKQKIKSVKLSMIPAIILSVTELRTLGMHLILTIAFINLKISYFRFDWEVEKRSWLEFVTEWILH